MQCIQAPTHPSQHIPALLTAPLRLPRPSRRILLERVIAALQLRTFWLYRSHPEAGLHAAVQAGPCSGSRPAGAAAEAATKLWAKGQATPVARSPSSNTLHHLGCQRPGVRCLLLRASWQQRPLLAALWGAGPLLQCCLHGC